MKKILFFLLMITTQVYGQGLSNRWVMGYSCCYPGFGGLDIDFSSGTPVIDTVMRFMNINCTPAQRNVKRKLKTCHQPSFTLSVRAK